jgi:HemY protein
VLRRDPEIVLDYCQYVRDDKQTEAVIRSTIKHHWDDQLAVMYSQSAKAMLTKRIKTAEGWQKNHPDNWALNACLGQLYEGNGEKDRAKVAYNKSLQMQPSVLAHERLAKLLAFDGEYAKSSDHLRQALKITQSSHQPSHHRQK